MATSVARMLRILLALGIGLLFLLSLAALLYLTQSLFQVWEHLANDLSIPF